MSPTARAAPPVFTPHEARQARRLAIVLGVIGGFFVLELAGALLAGSVVLQADAVHLLTDVLALGISLAAMRLAVRAPTAQFTFGLRRAEPVAAIVSGVLVLVTVGVIVAEALEALRGGTAPRAGVMVLVATGALVVHGASAWLLHDAIGHGPASLGGTHAHGSGEPTQAGHAHAHDHDHEHHEHGACDHDGAHGAAHAPLALPARRAHGHALNLRGAWLHLMADTLGAIAALAAALFIRFGGDPRADPLASFAVAAILLVGAVRLLRDASLVLLEAAPSHLPVATVRHVVSSFPGVSRIAELHVWTLGAGHDAVMLRVVTGGDDVSLARRLSAHVREALGAEYVAVQVEPDLPNLANESHGSASSG